MPVQPLFLLDALTWGVIAMMIFFTSTVIFTIPVFATRGATQLKWFFAVGFLLTLELALLVAVGVLISTGNLSG